MTKQDYYKEEIMDSYTNPDERKAVFKTLKRFPDNKQSANKYRKLLNKQRGNENSRMGFYVKTGGGVFGLGAKTVYTVYSIGNLKFKKPSGVSFGRKRQGRKLRM